MKSPFYLLAVLALVFHLSASAQKQKPQFAFTAGATFSSFKVTASGISVTSDIKVGFTLGEIISFPLGSKLCFQPALYLTQKGGVLKSEQENITERATYNYLELPLDFIYYPNNKHNGFFAGAGPVISYGLWGKYKITGMYSEDGSVKFGSAESDDLKSLEIGLNILMGYEFKSGITIAGNYNAGLNNLSNDPSAKLHNMYFGIRIGYFLK
jgi:hypothetical protein